MRSCATTPLYPEPSPAWLKGVCLRCFRAAAAALDEPRLHALLQLALLPAAAFAAPSAAVVLGFGVANARTRAVLRAMAASGFLEVRAEVCSCSRPPSVALRAI